MKKRVADIDGYIDQAPPSARKLLQQLRKTIHAAAPEAVECISYGMPAFKQGRVLVYFACWKNHIGFYPMPSGIAAFEKELARYASSKGAVHFPLDKALPVALVTKIVRFRVKETHSGPSRQTKRKRSQNGR